MRALLWIALVIISSDIVAEEYAPTPEEIAMCEKRVYSRPGQNSPDWSHMHHYCDGLRYYERALRFRNDKMLFNGSISASLGNFDYVLRATAPSFNMRPEVIVMRGRTLELAGKTFEAAQHYNDAIKLNPNFAMAYAALGNFYVSQKNQEQAKKVYTEGLRRNPQNRYLRSRVERLGGSVDSKSK